MVGSRDKDILRDLGGQVAEIAARPVHAEVKELWSKLNGLQMVRPMVMIDQICWHELNGNGDLTLLCEDKDCRRFENELRTTLYRWKHFPVDMVVEPYIAVPKAVTNAGFGLGRKAQVAVSDPDNPVVGHKFENQFETDADLEKIKEPRVGHDAADTERRSGKAHEVFDGILDVKESGFNPYLSLWDPIAAWMSVEGALYALVDRPDFIHKLCERMTAGYLSMIQQLEEQGLLCQPQAWIHCAGAYTDELPADGYDPDHPRTRDIWTFGLAQMFSTVSPAMFKEFEVDYVSRICERFGLVYYGCCDPLDGKMAQVRMIPNVRKVSMSPWVDQERGAREIGKDYVFSRKPSPALLATDEFKPDAVRGETMDTMEACSKYGCAVEFILKDISTIRYEPDRLARWADVVMDVVTKCG